MENMVLALHVIVCVILVILVLLQAGKEGMGVIFGGGGSSVFGSTGAGGILSKLTAFLAVMFIITSVTYTLMTKPATSAEDSVMQSLELEKDTPPSPLELSGEPAPVEGENAVPTEGEASAEGEAPAAPAEAAAEGAQPAGNATDPAAQ